MGGVHELLSILIMPMITRMRVCVCVCALSPSAVSDSETHGQ